MIMNENRDQSTNLTGDSYIKQNGKQDYKNSKLKLREIKPKTQENINKENIYKDERNFVSQKPIPKCKLCNREFAKTYNVIRHLRSAHPLWFNSKQHSDDKINLKKNSLQLKSLPNFECSICHKKFISKSNVNRHLKYAHNHPSKFEVKINKLTCSECKFICHSRKNFIDHVENKHGLSLKIEDLYFENKEDFDKWKSEIEKNSATKFIRNKIYKTASGIETINLICNRNGHFSSKSTGMRQLKKGGTNKIEYFCPANIFIKSKELLHSFPAHVTYCSTHLGHHCETEQMLKLKKKYEKNQSAAKFLSNVKSSNHGRLTQALELLKASHQIASERNDIEVFSIEQNTWIVPSFTHIGETYNVSWVNIRNNHKCDLICIECNACSHQYRCSCVKSLMEHNFCEHIHLVCLKQKLFDKNKQHSQVLKNQLEFEFPLDNANENILDEFARDNISENIAILDEFARDNVSENSAILNEFDNDNSRSLKEEAKSLVLSFLRKIETFRIEDQYREIISTMITLNHKCDALAKPED